MSKKRQPMDPAVIHSVGSHILSAQLAGHRDPASIDQGHLDHLADMSVRAAVALTDAVPRAQKRMDDEDKAAVEAEEMEKAEAEDRRRGDEAAAKEGKIGPTQARAEAAAAVDMAAGAARPTAPNARVDSAVADASGVAQTQGAQANATTADAAEAAKTPVATAKP